MKWLPRSASESAFPSMIDTFFDRAVPLKGASVAPGTYVQTRGTSIACTKVVFTWVSYRDEHGPALLLSRSSSQESYMVPVATLSAASLCAAPHRAAPALPPSVAVPIIGRIVNKTARAHSRHADPAHTSPPPATAARSRTHRDLLSTPAHNSSVRSTRTAAPYRRKYEDSRA